MPKPDDNKTEDGKVAPVDAPTTPTTPTAPTTPDKADGKTVEPTEPILGKFKSQDDLVKAYTELESKHGKQSTQVSELRSAQAQLADRLAKSEAAKEEPKTDYEAALKDIRDKVDDGTITVTEGMEQQGRLIHEMTVATTLSAAEQKTQELLMDEKAKQAEVQWHKDYPDYQEFVASGLAEEYKAKSPMLIDETIAYFMHKETEATKKGMDIQEKLDKGTKTTEKVLDEPGVQVPRTPTRQTPLSPDELEAQQLATIARMRGEA